MEGVGARLGRSSSRYGASATVFTGPVRKWKKKWIHVTPSSTDNNNNNNIKNHSSSNGNNNNDASHILLYKWTPIRKTYNNNSNSNGDADDDDDDSVDEEPPRRKMKYIPIALLEEQNNEAQTDEAIPDENDPIAQEAEPSSKPDMNDVPMEENQVSESIDADLNKGTVGLSLNLNARDDGDADGDEEQPNGGGLSE